MFRDTGFRFLVGLNYCSRAFDKSFSHEVVSKGPWKGFTRFFVVQADSGV